MSDDGRVVPIRREVWQHVHRTPMLRWHGGKLEKLMMVEGIAEDRVTVVDIRQEWRAVPTEDAGT